MLKLQYFGHLMQRANSLEKTLLLEKIEGKRRKGQQKLRGLDSITDSMDMNLSKFLDDTMISVHFQSKPFNITVMQVYAPTSNAEEVEVEQFYIDQQDLLELTPSQRCPFHYRGLE